MEMYALDVLFARQGCGTCTAWKSFVSLHVVLSYFQCFGVWFFFTLKVHFKGFKGSTLENKEKDKRIPRLCDATLHHMYKKTQKTTYSADLNVRSVHLRALRWRGENEIRPFRSMQSLNGSTWIWPSTIY